MLAGGCEEERKEAAPFRLVRLIDETGASQKEFGIIHDYGDNLFLIDAGHGAKVYHYKITE